VPEAAPRASSAERATAATPSVAAAAEACTRRGDASAPAREVSRHP
jgi:hypothetical protein